MDNFKDYNKKVMVREVSTKKNHLISVFNNFEVTFSDKKKKYFDKLQSLPAAWEQICNFVLESSSESPQPQFESLFLHTLKFVLRADWRHASKATKTHLTLILQRLINELTNSKNHMSILPQCRVLESVINEPWDHPVLKKIFQDEETTIDELIDYFHLENGKVVLARLEMLLESKCEDLAFRLSKSCLMTYNSTHPLELDLNQNEYNYIMDMYLCCSFKIKNTSDLIAEMKNFDLCEGLQLLRRYRLNGGVAGGYNDSCKEARIWKSSKKTIELISNTLLANAVLHDDLDDADVEFLQELISEWASVHTTSLNEIFAPVPSEVIRKCVLIARCSKCIYPFCSFLIECGGKEKDINQVTRCLIRGINQNMNEIEQYRVNSDREKLRSAYELLCKGFILISSLFSEYKNIYKECLLTAFSIAPSREYLQKMEELVIAESAEENDSKSKIENNNETSVDDQSEIQEPTESSEQMPAKMANESINVNENNNTENTEQTPVKKEVLSDSLCNDGIRGHVPAYLTEVEGLQVEESLKTDLNSILRYQRYHALTWDLKWDELKSNCEKYLEIFAKRGFDEVELKYLDLDYEQFKNKPSLYEDFGGIEKGYERYVVLSDYTDDEIDALEKSSLTSDETDSNDEDYGRRKRKKQKAKKKRPRPKPKVEYSETDDWEDFPHLENIESGARETRSKKRRRKRPEECDLKLQRKRGRTRKTLETNEETSDANIDSQSENQPPPNNDIVADDGIQENISNAKCNSNNLQMLRQFRINGAKCEDSADKTEKSCKDIFVNGNRLQELQICIPKCDAMTVNGSLNLNLSSIKKRKYESDEEVEGNCKKLDETEGSQNDENQSIESELINSSPRRPKLRSNQKLKKLEQGGRYGNERHLSKYMQRKQRKLAAVPPVGHFTGESLAQLNDTLYDIFGDLLKDSEIQISEKVEEMFTAPVDIPTSAPLTKSSDVIPVANTTFKKSSYLVPSSETIKPLQPSSVPKSAATEPKTNLSVILSPLKSSDYTVPKISPVYTTPTKLTTSSLPSFAKISSSKLTTSRISSYIEPSTQSTSPLSRVNHIASRIGCSVEPCAQSTSSASLVNNTATYRISNYDESSVPSNSSASCISNVVSSYLTSSIENSHTTSSRDSRLKPQPSSSSPSVSVPISSLLPNESLYPVVRIPNIRSAISTSTTIYDTQYSSSSPQQLSSVTYSQNFNSKKLITSSTDIRMSDFQSKLREALQKPDSSYTSSNPIKSSAKDGNVNVVHQILGEYRQTISQFPELEHVPAQRKRSGNANPSRRQRKSKKESTAAMSSFTTPVTNSSLSEGRRYYPKTTNARCSTSASFVNRPTNNQMSSIRTMSQTSTTSNQVLQTGPSNVRVPSSSVSKLPSYSTSVGSSQNYDSGYKSVSSSYLSSEPTITVNGYPENIIAQTNIYANNAHTSPASMRSSVSRTAVTNNVNIINGSHIVQNSLYANQSYAISSPSNPMEMPVSNANVVHSGNGCNVDNGYKSYSYSESMPYDTRNTVIAGTSNNYKNVVPMNNSQNVNSTMVSRSMNNDLKTSLFYATVSNEESTANDHSSPCISIPEDQYSEPYFGSYLALIEDNNSLLPQSSENVYLKTENVTVSNGQSVQFISATTHIPKQDTQSYDHNVLFNVGDLFYPFPQ